ncbi:hypothetical protein BGZ70_010218 [Mortierella alpina]|uniref:NADP-dependent oxidoreductase domain-containing protein n=1 Tax=Mortierella alpina TaxID=64518 RepID=A0A9P6M662_MORAP|nr:hypothetical protein BGZ70_010218 [Mortierella alpina]
MSLGRIAKLNTGATIPLLGLGTWQSSPSVVKTAVKTAIAAGYRHIDTAWIYGNEKEVGEAIRESNVPREELFVTTKLWNNSHRPQDVAPALETSLKNLGLDYIDLYLIVELHPENPQWELLEFCKDKGIHVTAYSPLGSTDSPLIKREEISRIAEKHNSSNANVLIAWGQQRGTSVIPKSVTESRIVSNFKDIELDLEDLKVLKAITQGKEPHRYCDPKTFWDIDVFN